MRTVATLMRSVLLLCIPACTAITVCFALQRNEPTPDHLAATARLYEPVRAHIHDRDQIGFASFKDSEHGYLMRYYLAQSVLAPTLVVESTDHDVVLASFSEDWRLDAFLADNPFVERARFPGGIAILERTRQQ